MNRNRRCQKKLFRRRIGDCNHLARIRGIRVSHLSILVRASTHPTELCLGEKQAENGLAIRLVERWLSTPFDGGRHALRLEKITAVEQSK